MIISALALLTAAIGLPSEEAVELAQLTIRQRVVIRIPTVSAPPPPERRMRWKERKGPKCVQIGALAGAVVTGPESVDIFLRGGDRMRVQLDRQCEGVDLGYGFYIRPTPDGRMCADRDTIHARTGGQCGIERFRALVPDR